MAEEAGAWPRVELKGRTIPREVLQIIPESTAREHKIVAYEHTPAGLRVAMADPADRQIVEFIRKKVDQPVEVFQATEAEIHEALGRYQESLETELKMITQEAGRLKNKTDLKKVAEDLPTIRITEAIFKHAILQRASDIHIEPLENQVLVRYRIDGILYEKLVLPTTALAGLVARIKVLANLKIDEHRLPQDGRFKIKTPDYEYSFRVSVLPVFDGEKVVMRLLDESGKGLRLEDIGLSPPGLEIFRRAINKPHGMVLVTGPTGSGKTTTLYAAMQELNTTEVNISTIEDPIEYRMPRINQTQVKPRIGLTFANGLRSLVRQDPDIIMVGEIRDEETASLAVNAALTGHLVLSTLHTNSAAGALPRLLDMKVESFLVASTVNLLVAQRLVRRLCTDCRKQAAVTAAMQDTLKQVGLALPPAVYEPAGCNQCHDGYKGRVGIYEFLEMTPELQPLVTATTTARQLEEAARKQQGMVTMLEDGVTKAAAGVTTLEEVLRVATE